MKFCIFLSILAVGCNAQGILERIAAQDNVFFTGHDPSEKTDFLQFVPADPTKQNTNSVGDLDTTLLVYTREREDTHYWGMTASYEAKKVWANNMRLGQLKEFNLDTGVVKTVARDLTDGLENIAYDRITKNLYWTDSINKKIRAMEMSYCYHTDIHTSDTTAPYALALHVVKRKLFYSSYLLEKNMVSKTEITKCDLDGSNKRVILSFPDVIRPRGMTIDYEKDALFWTDMNLFQQSVVMASDLDGFRKKTFFTKSRSYLWGVAHYKGFIYATDIANNTDNKYEIHIRKTDGSKSYTYESPLIPRNVAIYGPDETKTIKISNECDGSRCEHICLARGKGGFVCKCSPGFKLVDGYKCEPESLNDDYLLVADIGQKRAFQLAIKSYASSAGNLVAVELDDTCMRKYAVSTIKSTGAYAWYDITEKEIVWETKRLSFNSGINSITTGCCNTKVYWNTDSAIYSWDGVSTAKTIYRLPFFTDSIIRQVVVDCKASFLYWVEYDSILKTASVKRSSLEGRDVETVLSGFANTFTLTIDFETYTLHVLTATEGVLYSLPLKDISGRIPSRSPNYRGYKRTQLVPYMKNKNFLFFGITAVGGYVYIIDDVNDEIIRFNWKTGASSLEKYGKDQIFFPTALDFYSSAHYQKYLRPICKPGFSLQPTAQPKPITATMASTTVAPAKDCVTQYTDDLTAGMDTSLAFGRLLNCLLA